MGFFYFAFDELYYIKFNMFYYLFYIFCLHLDWFSFTAVIFRKDPSFFNLGKTSTLA